MNNNPIDFIDKAHPVWMLLPWIEDPDYNFLLSKYIYTKDSLSDKREYVILKGGLDWKERLCNLIKALSPEEEVSLHSNILKNGKLYHLPMLDFAKEKLNEKDLERIKNILPEGIGKEMVFFKTGRSWHGYGRKLLNSNGELINFLAQSLLINLPNEAPIVDPRWIAHRILAKQGGLRITSNSSRHDFPPKLKDPIADAIIDSDNKVPLIYNNISF